MHNIRNNTVLTDFGKSALDIELSDLIKRKFTKELEEQTEKTVYDLFTWEKEMSYLPTIKPEKF